MAAVGGVTYSSYRPILANLTWHPPTLFPGTVSARLDISRLNTYEIKVCVFVDVV
jgi:hypothetical protein